MEDQSHEHHAGDSHPARNMTTAHTRPGHEEGRSLTGLAISATIHCLSGCAIGEVLGMIIGTAIGLGTAQTILLAVILAFISGFGLTMIPLLRGGLGLGRALKLAFLADAASITIMEIVDNAVMLIIPGAMTAGLASPLFWASLVASLVIAGIAAYPVNRWLIDRGSGHAVVHRFH